MECYLWICILLSSIDYNGLYTKFRPGHITSSSNDKSTAWNFLFSNHNLKNTLKGKSLRKVLFLVFIPISFLEEVPTTLSPTLVNPEEISPNFSAILQPLKKAELFIVPVLCYSKCNSSAVVSVTDENRQFAASWENNRRNEKTNDNSQDPWPRERRVTSFSHIQSWKTWIQFSSFHPQQIIQMFPIPSLCLCFCGEGKSLTWQSVG